MNANIVEVNARDNKELSELDKFLLSVVINLIGWERVVKTLTNIKEGK